MSTAVADIAQLQEAVSACPPGRRLLPVAGATKPAMSSSARDDVDPLDVSALTGIVEYDPSELTFTAMAATPAAEVAATLAEHGQYLPFDPPLIGAGATLGGIVASGGSGPNALRHGTLRDFVIGVRFVDGLGRVVGGGGKVVKNAAGFDLPKLMVGSLGRLGVITQLSFKVFPRPRATVTLEFSHPDIGAAVAAACTVAAAPLQVDAIDVLQDGRLLVRLGGDAEALAARAERLLSRGLCGDPAARHNGDAERSLWQQAAELQWLPQDRALVRVPLSSRDAVSLVERVAAHGGETRLSLGVNVAWVAWPASEELSTLEQLLQASGLSGAVLTGATAEPLIGASASNPFGERIRRALDPHDRFLEVH